MIEIRNLTERYKDEHGQIIQSEPKLQYRFKFKKQVKKSWCEWVYIPVWSEWQDVEDVNINEGEE
jgi:hypothetical protein